jgi:hypothetical protein
MQTWTPVLASALGGCLVLLGVALTQSATRRREVENHFWARKADAYVALIRWRLEPPDDEQIANPHHLAEAEEAWKKSVYPLLAEASLFSGPNIRRLLGEEKYLWRAVGRLASLTPTELAEQARQDLTTHSADAGRVLRRRADGAWHGE